MTRFVDTSVQVAGLKRCCGKAFDKHHRYHSETYKTGDKAICPQCSTELVLGSDNVWRVIQKEAA